MLKKVMISNKEIPVPIPLLTYEDAMAWVRSLFVKDNQVITRVELDGIEIVQESAKVLRTRLTDKSSLMIQVDSPRDISIQVIDTIRDLAKEIDQRLNYLAIKCWQLPSKQHKNELLLIMSDLEMISEMIAHINEIVDYSHADMAPVNGLDILIQKVISKLNSAIEISDWKLCARILVNRLEPLVKELTLESEALELRLFSAESSSDLNVGSTRYQDLRP